MKKTLELIFVFIDLIYYALLCATLIIIFGVFIYATFRVVFN